MRARKAKLVLVSYSGYAARGSSQRIRIKVVDGKIDFIHWSYMYSFPQSAISYNS